MRPNRGDGIDQVTRNNRGTFNGGAGIDTIRSGNPAVDGPSGT
jgi:hypothetical protein